MKKQPLLKNRRCHPQEFEAQAGDDIGYVCSECGAVLISPSGMRLCIDSLSASLDKIPSFIKLIFIR